MKDYTGKKVCANCLHCKVIKYSGNTLETCRAICIKGMWGEWHTSVTPKARFVRYLAEGKNVTVPDCNFYDPVQPPDQVKIVLADIRKLKYRYMRNRELTVNA